MSNHFVNDPSLSQLSDSDLITSFGELVISEQEGLLLQLEHVMELDRRKLFFHHSSLWSYLVSEHGLEEWRAERLIKTARTLRRFPELKIKFKSGKLNLSLLEIAQGCAHREKLTDLEFKEVIERISGMSCRMARKELASLYPQTAASSTH